MLGTFLHINNKLDEAHLCSKRLADIGGFQEFLCDTLKGRTWFCWQNEELAKKLKVPQADQQPDLKS